MTLIKSYPLLPGRIWQMVSLSSVLYFFNIFCCSAQYFSAPKPVNRMKEYELLRSIPLQGDNIVKVDMLLSLSNIYYYRPERKVAFIMKSIGYANQAATLSKKLANKQKYYESKYLESLGMLIENKFPEVEAIIPSLDDKTRCDLLVALGFHLLNTRLRTDEMRPEAERILLLAKSLSIRLKAKRNELIARECLSIAAFQMSKKTDAGIEIEKVVQEYKKYKVGGIQYAYYLAADFYNSQSKNDIGMPYLRAGIKAMEVTGDQLVEGDLYRLLAVVFKQEDEFEKELEAYRRALAAYKRYPGIADMYYGIQGIAFGLIHLKKPEEALRFLDSATRENKPETYIQKLTIVNMYANTHLALKDNKNAEKYFLERFRLVRVNHDESYVTFDRMGYFYIESKQYSKARPFLEEAIRRITPSTTTPSAITSTKYRLYLVDSAEGKYLSAIRQLSATHSFSDSVAKDKKKKEIANLLVQYEDDKKQNMIRSLQQKAQLDLANIQRASLVRNLSIAGVLLMLILGGIFYRQSMIRQKLNKEILAKNRRQEVLLSRLNRLLSEKQWLLKEVHHRVKNNLHTIISLLNLQAEFLKDDALLAIENSQHRIHAMSLIHSKLYASEDVQNIDMWEYIKELVAYLKDGFGDAENISYSTEIDALLLDVGQAMPLGLIINEAVTNSIKYAFPAGRKGTISIQLSKVGKLVRLVISDNGIGMVSSARDSNLSSLGLKLIEGLSADINGELTIESDNGTKLIISFDPEYLNSLTVIEEEEMA